MIHIFINALAATAGGGITYIRNVLPHLARRSDVRATVLVDSVLRPELAAAENVQFVEAAPRKGMLERVWFEQKNLPKLIRQSGADVLLSAGNFALWHSPVPQILLSRNALYTSKDFERDLRRRGDYRLWIDTEAKAVLAEASIQKADITVAPSEAFAQELQDWTGKKVLAIHHGFDQAAFTQDRTPLPEDIQRKLAGASDCLRLLYVSHYNYYRNFETLIRALPFLRDRLAPRKLRLFLTCQLRSEANPGTYGAESVSRLVRELGLSEQVIELGSISYTSLHQVYRSSDVYVTAAYAESFAHPLVEAMSCRLPIVASDLSVHREICREAAVYFERFSAQAAAERIAHVADSPGKRHDMSTAGQRRASDFSWEKHVDQLASLASTLLH